MNTYIRTNIQPLSNKMPEDKFKFLNDWLLEEEKKGTPDPHEYALKVIEWNIAHKSDNDE